MITTIPKVPMAYGMMIQYLVSHGRCTIPYSQNKIRNGRYLHQSGVINVAHTPSMTNNPTHDLFAKTLITGSDGMVGSYIHFGVRMNHHSLDVTNLSNVMSVCTEHMPRVIINFAAATDLARCQQDPAYAYTVNSVGTYNLALAARRIGAKLVYISTFAVCDGTKKEPYTETDIPNPLNIYGHSKYLGELAASGILDDFLLVRASWIFGGGKDKDIKFVGKILKQLDKDEIKIITDKRGSPTYAKDLVASIRQLITENKKGI